MRERVRVGQPGAGGTQPDTARAHMRSPDAASPTSAPALGSGAGRVDRLKALQRRVGNRSVARLLSSPPTSAGAARIQRVVVRGGGDRQQTKDLVNTVIGFQDFGITPGQINAEEFPGGDPASAVAPPVLTATATPDGQTAVRVTAEPVNVVDYRMELPTAPPWTRAVNKSETIPFVEMVAGGGYANQIQPLRDHATEATTFRVAGAPDDAAFAGLVETHEDQHVADLWETTDQILEPWDANLRLMRESGAPITAADEATARAALFEAAGGTTAEIGQQFTDDMRDRGVAFHGTAAGGPPIVDDVTAGTAPNRLTLRWRHPLG